MLVLQLIEGGSDDGLWGRLFVRRLSRNKSSLKPMFKVEMDKMLCHLDAGTWVPSWDTGSTLQTQQHISDYRIQPSSSQNVQHTANPARGASLTPAGQVSSLPVMSATNAMEGASGVTPAMPPGFKLPPDATTAMVYRGRPTEAGLRHYIETQAFN